MTGTPNPSSAGSSGAARVQTKISVSDPKIMVNLLGAKDEILRLIERTLASDVHVRGNEITITGEQADAERVARGRFGPPPYDDRTALRVVGFLARRGFDPDAVAAAVGRPTLD